MNTPSGTDPELATRSTVRIIPDPGRVIAKLFVPGEEVPENESRTAAVISRVLSLDDGQVHAALANTLESFEGRHRGLRSTFSSHFETISHRIPLGKPVSNDRRLLIGAYFTHEYAIEGAALCNPSMVAHPDQDGLEEDQTRFVLSARAIGEGHLSCIELRTGVFGPGTRIEVDPIAPTTSLGRARAPEYDRRLFESVLSVHADDDEVTAFLHRHLPARFSAADLEHTLRNLPTGLNQRQGTHRTVERIRWIAASTYDLEFPTDTGLSERVLWPTGPTERQGMEDARFVRFTEDEDDEDGADGPSYYATYTAFDGITVAPQRLHTRDFRVFQATQLSGPAAANKGMALFPRKVGGKYLALSRWDRENTSITVSADNQTWSAARTIQTPAHSWELTQVGNCGSPIETDRGWLVLTHGVGPMRTYSIGAILLDLEHPEHVIANLEDPLITPRGHERDGYVPNVVYSCGAMRHRDTLVVPYGTSDTAIGFATVPIPDLLSRMRPVRPAG
ncbi:glycoside hydrolase family 130 protein [Actinospica sp.]|jgi:predicted GH43/DUF377 family glycosyl hydrolase|uniref:glycoside hydrolase family 130 protein n=1 Tax=Actinospica sp. TaxID=1872142 RepID=UPI002CB0C6F1|nr:glycoside hydrolase family 130 protein [Actinospica sp.]HWG25215.1 glycoside hydrolase family 130 protein [Actinospica sp.]